MKKYLFRLLASALPLVAFMTIAAPAFAQTVAFQPEGPYSGTTQPTDIVRADFDGDDDLDLAAIANSSGTVTIFENTGNGAYFTLPTTFASNASDPSSIDRGDFNGDGKPDLVVTDLATDSVYVLLNNSAPNNISFLSPVSTSTGGNDPTDVAVGDFNNDSKDDLAVTNFTSNNVAILLSNGDGTFTPASSPVTVSGNPIAADAANFDNKSGLDVVVASYSNSSVTLLINDGKGSFTAAPSAVTVDSGPTDIIARDFNNDGNQDFATANSGSVVTSPNDISVALGTGNGTFEPSSKFFAQTSLIAGPPSGIASELRGADYNCDGNPDIAVTSPSNNIVQVLTGNGNGNFNGPTAFSVGNTPSGLTSGDFDKPNGADLATSNFGSNNVSVLLNTSPNCGTVTPNPPTFTKTDSPDPVTVGHNLTYTLSVTNNGTGTAQNVTITDILPTQVTFSSASSSCTNASNTVTCNVGSLASGATTTVQIVVQVNQSGTFTNSATVQSLSFPSATATATTTAQTNPNRRNNYRNNYRNGLFHRFFRHFFNPQYGNQYGNGQYGNNQGPGSASTATGQYEGTSAGNGVSASAGPGGASANAGGTSAQAEGTSGNPDTQPPVSGPQGEVVPTVDTGGEPLPPTGGIPVWKLASLAAITLAPLVGLALVGSSRLWSRWWRRRSNSRE